MPIALASGDRLGRFVVRSQLGQGGMGVVYAGDDPELARPVAIKIVRSDVDQPGYRDRLLREAQVMARLEHPNIVRVYEVGTDAGRLFVAMEFVDGETLKHWLATPRTWPQVRAMFVQIGEGLEAVHRNGLVHRDFKPDNVLVDRDGRARVADFGLARLDDNSAPQLTKTNAVMGTPGYMAPEQQWGSDVDARADQYSFCVALREATRGLAVPPGVKAAIARGLSYDAAERFASMTELLAALAPTRRRIPWPYVGLGVLVVAGGAIAYLAATRAPTVETRVETKVEKQYVSIPSPIVIPQTPATPPPPPAPVVAKKPAASAPAKPVEVASVSPPPAPPPPPRKVIPAPTSRHEIEPAHVVPVRVFVHDLGYAVVKFTGDPDDETEVRAALANLGPDDDLERGKDLFLLGTIQRHAGKCDSAAATWKSARETLAKYNAAHRTDDEMWHWFVRAWFGEALCLADGGHGLAAMALLDGQVRQNSFGFSPTERAEFHAAAGIVGFETGVPNAFLEIRQSIELGSHATKRLEQAVDNWANSVGIK